MRLYLESDILDLVKRLPAMREKGKKDKEEMLERRRYQRVLDRQAEAVKAREAVEAFKAPDLVMMKTGRLGLPQEIVYRVLELICDEYEPTGIRMMTIVVEELHQIAMACPDFLAALPHCYKYLASKVEPIPGQENRDWDEFIADPNQFKVPELTEAVRDLGLKVTGTKDGQYSRFESTWLTCRADHSPTRLFRTQRAKKDLCKTRSQNRL